MGPKLRETRVLQQAIAARKDMGKGGTDTSHRRHGASVARPARSAGDGIARCDTGTA
jgi:hypothetical protein